MPERRQLPYDWMTSAERLDRIIELLAQGAIRSVQDQDPVEHTINLIPVVAAFNPSLPSPKGRIPFGEQQTGLGRAINPSENNWLKRIQDLAATGLSSEQIAKRLSQEDRESKRAGKWSRTAVWRILQRSKKKAVTE